MRKSIYWGGLAFALALLILSLTNASWLAPYPAGAPKQIAHRAIGPEFITPPQQSCDGAEIYEATSRHLPNTRGSILRADRMGGWLIEVDPQLTADGDIVLFESSMLDCLTNGEGPILARTLAEVQALDAGYGYFTTEVNAGQRTSQNTGGRAHPFRGKGAVMPTLGDIARAIPRQARLIIHMPSDNAALADAVARALDTAGRDPVDKGDAFYGDAAQMARIRETYPGIWAFNAEEARQCTADYTKTGWLGIVPSSCESGTMLIALDDQALLWGWPNRLIARMQDAGVKILIEGPDAAPAGGISGITLPEQLTEIPSSFNGYIWTDDAFNTLPALIQRYDNRTQEEIDASQAALERRRASQ